MRLRSPWSPRLAEGNASPVARLAEALSQDIVTGALEGGARLPAHRDLAWQLCVSVGTVTKAYALLERRGLTRSVKGRGTFVALWEGRRGAAIDLSRNAPPVILSDRLLARTFAALSRKIEAAHINLRPPPAGHTEHRRLVGRWLRDLSVEAEAERIVLTGGGQQALWLAFDILCGGRGTIVTERWSYAGAVALARYRGHPLRAVAMDEEGMIPADLARVLDEEAESGRRRLVYVTPTLHNPTTRTMGDTRRRDILDVCADRDVPIVEDAVIAPGSDGDSPPLIGLDPERVFHVTSLSKTLTPGLKLGVLVLPAPWIDRAQEALATLPLISSPIDYALLEEWFSSGVVASVRASLRAEAIRRTELARSILPFEAIQTGDGAFHAWLPMRHDKAEAFVRAAADLGVILPAPDAVRADREDAVSGVALCLGAPANADLVDGLTILSRIDVGLRRGEPGAG